MDEKLIQELVAKSPNRRSFVKKLSIASAAVAAAGALPKTAEAQTATDVAVLQFALNLEYLEAEFYSYAVTGQGIDQMGVNVTSASGTTFSGTPGVTTGGSQVSFTDSITAGIASELMYDELQHVVLLQTALLAAKVAPIARPAINLGALGFGFAYQNQFLSLARIFEEIGVTAYGGAAPMLPTASILAVAARILAVEAEHVGAIRLLLTQAGYPTGMLDGADVLPPPSGSFYFSTNGIALTSVRTPAQVLYLAYGGKANATSGGFFPAGVNGGITMSSATAATLDGPTLTLTPNPITGSGGYGQTTVSWNAPSSLTVNIRIGSPSGPLFANSGSVGSMLTGNWVANGTKFYLLDSSSAGKGSSLGSVMAVATAIVQ